MRKMTKNQRINQIADQLARQQGVISKLTIAVKEQNEAILMLEKLTDEKLRDQPEPQLKQLDQSVFDGLDEKWRFAAVDRNGRAFLFSRKPTANIIEWYAESIADYEKIGNDYDTTDWQNSLIERDTAKELTGSDLCREVLKTRRAVARVSDISDFEAADLGSDNASTAVLRQCDDGLFYTTNGARRWFYAVLINNQGEPLTAADVGL